MTGPNRSSAEIDAQIPESHVDLMRRLGEECSCRFCIEARPAEPAWMTDSPPANRPQTPRVRTLQPAGLPVLDWTAITAEPEAPPPTLAPGIPEVGLTVLAGPPKVGKTLYASQTALTVGRSTIVVEEGSLAGVSYRLRRQAFALDLAAPDLVVIHRQRIRLDNRASVARLREHVEARRPRLLVLDPLNRLHGADENRPSQMTPVMDALAGIAYDFGIAVVCVHHLAKPSAERRGDVWDRFRGATSIRSGTDANLILDGSGASIRLVGEFRDAEPMNEWLTLDRDTLLFVSAEAPKIPGRVDRDELLAFVDESGRVTARDVMVRFGIKSKATALAALEAMPELDRGEGPRGLLLYFRTTVQ